MVSAENSHRSYAFSGGGTGGHLMPGMALASALRLRDPQANIAFVGSNKPFERDLVAKFGYPHFGLDVEPLKIAKIFPWRFLSRNWQAYRIACDWLTEHRPQFVIGLGGYASAPLVVAAKRQSIPVFLLEQNVVPGRATRWLAPRVNSVFAAFEETRRYIKGPMCAYGTPVRPEIAALAHADFDSSSTPTLLVLGGSQGATSLNEAVLEATGGMKDLLQHWQIIHQTGAEQAPLVRERYERLGLSADVEPFIADMAGTYKRATIVISRAGGTTLAELACAGCPAILVPFPFAADDHQLKNAEFFVRSEAARLVTQHPDCGVTAANLKAELASLLNDADRRKWISLQLRKLAQPHATESILGLIGECVAIPEPV